MMIQKSESTPFVQRQLEKMGVEIDPVVQEMFLRNSKQRELHKVPAKEVAHVYPDLIGCKGKEKTYDKIAENAEEKGYRPCNFSDLPRIVAKCIKNPYEFISWIGMVPTQLSGRSYILEIVGENTGNGKKIHIRPLPLQPRHVFMPWDKFFFLPKVEV